MTVANQRLNEVVAPVQLLWRTWPLFCLTSSCLHGMWLLIWPPCAFVALPQGSENFPAVHHSVIQWDLALPDSLWSAMSVRSIGNTMLIRPNEQDVVGVLEALVE